MTISSIHGRYSGLLARLIHALTEELDMPICTCRDMTCDREDLERGLEPDECFYIVNESAIRNREVIDLVTDPPPDLAVEIEISRSPRNRLSIYAALGVPEVWRFDGQTLTIHQLGSDGQYAIAEHSRYFALVTGAELVPFLHQRTQTDENSLVRQFRQWVRSKLQSAK